MIKKENALNKREMSIKLMDEITLRHFKLAAMNNGPFQGQLLLLITRARVQYRLSTIVSNNNHVKIWKDISANHDMVNFVLSAIAEIRFRLFETKTEWHDFVSMLAESYGSTNLSKSIIEGSFKDEIATPVEIKECLDADPWIIVIILMAYSSVDMSKYKIITKS